jgi:hypothetical protein
MRARDEGARDEGLGMRKLSVRVSVFKELTSS